MTLDKAPHFKLVRNLSDKLWHDAALHAEVPNYSANRGIRLNFIIHVAPWMGGFYERLLGLVNRALRKSLGKILLTPTQLETVVVEIEAILNSRPCFISDLILLRGVTINRHIF